MTGSTVPAALTALAATVRTAVAALAAPAVEVVDGQPTNVERDLVCLAYSPDGPGVTFTPGEVDAALGQQRETFDVLCIASTWRGDSDDDARAAVRTRAFAITDAVAAAVAADRTLGGTVARAKYRGEGYTQALYKGAVSTVSFAIEVEAWRKPA